MADSEAIAVATDEALVPWSAGVYDHYCQHPGCGEWGDWGYARGKATIWYCGEHREDGERVGVRELNEPLSLA